MPKRSQRSSSPRDQEPRPPRKPDPLGRRGKAVPTEPQTARQWSFRLAEGWRADQQQIRDQIGPLPPGERSNELHQGIAWAERLIIRQRTLDRVLKECVTRPRSNVQPELWTMMQLGAAELLFGPQQTQYAAISETVELTRFAGLSQGAGFVNGVLRSVQRLLADTSATESATESAAVPTTGPTAGPSASTYPVFQGEFRSLNQALFPDPAVDRAGYLGLAFSLPDELAREWTRRFAGETLWPVAWSTLESPPLAVRVHRLAIEPAAWQARCAQAGIPVEATTFPEAFLIRQKVRLSDLPGFADGEIVVQDTSAMQAARMLNPYPKDRVLDLCAGPGTKTTQLAELMLDQGELLACDVTQAKIDLIEDNIRRLGLTCVKTQWVERQHPEIPGDPFQAVLVDVPCSNTGVLGKRPEARWRYCSEELKALGALQYRLLDAAAAVLAEDGRLVYSTCSIEPTENAELIIRWLEANPDFCCVDMQTMLPGPTCDGGFCARIEHRDDPEMLIVETDNAADDPASAPDK